MAITYSPNHVLWQRLKEIRPECHSTSWNTDVSKDNSAALQEVVDYASANGLVVVLNTSFKINKTINIPSNTVIISDNYSKITTDVGSSGNGMVMLQGIEKKDITIRGIRIENNGFGKSGSFEPAGTFDGSGACLLFAGCENVVIDNCIVEKGGGYAGGEGVGNIWLSCCTRSKIINNTVRVGDNAICVDRWYAYNNVDGKDRSGIYNQDIIISNNTLYHMSGRGMAIENINDKGSFTITGNTISGFGWSAIEGRNFTNCVISNNTIEGSKSTKVSPNGWNWNTWDNGYFGIEILAEAYEVVISGNAIRNLKNHAISLFNLDTTTIIGNKIKNCLQNGVFVKNQDVDCKGAVINSNVMYDVENGIHIKKDIGNAATLENFNINNNVIRFKNTGIIVEESRFFNVSDNNLRPLVDYGGTVGIKMSQTYRGNVHDNGVYNCTKGVDIYNDNTSNTKNKIDTCTTGVSVSNCTDTILEDTIRGGTTAVSSTTSTGVDASKTALKGTITTLKSGTGVYLTYRGLKYNGKAAPTDGNWDKGDIIYNNNPNASEWGAMICVTTGSPGTWKGLYAIQV